jgi:hypothetical protein
MANDPTMSGAAQGINRNLAQLARDFSNKFALSAFSGSFICAAATSTTVNDANVKLASKIFLMPANAAAGALEAGANKPYVSARNAGVSFVITGAAAAAGTETYEYIIVNVG